MPAKVIKSTTPALTIESKLALVTPVTTNPISSPPLEFLILAKTVVLPATVEEALRYWACVNEDSPLMDWPTANWTLVISGFCAKDKASSAAMLVAGPDRDTLNPKFAKLALSLSKMPSSLAILGPPPTENCG